MKKGITASGQLGFYNFQLICTKPGSAKVTIYAVACPSIEDAKVTIYAAACLQLEMPK